VRSLLREGLDHITTWTHVVNALGYCQRHTWEMGRFEVQHHGSALSTSNVYTDLVRVVCGRLADYAKRAAAVPHSRWRRVLDRLLCHHRGLPLPDELQPQESCRVCQIGEQGEFEAEGGDFTLVSMNDTCHLCSTS